MKKGFIFDLDGVIVDTAKYHYLAWKSLANSLGFDFTESQNEQFKGVSRVRSLDILLELGQIKASRAEKNKWLDKKNEEYLAFISTMNENEILPDVPKILQFLIDSKQGIALGSASKNARPILQKIGLIHKFEVIVDGNDVTTAKPDPEVFLIGAQKLGFDPKNCVVFEDSIAGIQAANTARMVSVGIGDLTILQEADYNFKDFTEISNEFLSKLISA